MDYLYSVGTSQKDISAFTIASFPADSAFPIISALYNNTVVFLRNTYIVLGKGTYGIVYLYKSLEIAVAVKFFTNNDDVVVFKEKKYMENEMGHPLFFAPTERTASANIIPTAVFASLHIMQLGIPIHDFLPFRKIPPATPQEDIFSHYYSTYASFAQQSTNELLAKSLCYTDFKTENVVVVVERGKIAFFLADIDAIGCLSTQIDNIHESANRIASFPITGNQSILGYPIVDMIQTWYSALVSCLDFFVYLIGKSSFSPFYRYHKVAKALIASLNHRFFKKSTLKRSKHFTHHLFSPSHPIHTTLQKLTSWFPPLHSTIQNLENGIALIKNHHTHFNSHTELSNLATKLTFPQNS